MAHDPDRIRGEALRRSLRFTMLSWLPGAIWQGAVNGAPLIELARHLGANDFIFSLLGAAPLAGVLLQIPGWLTLEWIGVRKKFFIANGVPARSMYVLMGLLPWFLPVKVMWPAMVMVILLLIYSSLGNFGDSAWQNWMATMVPERVRGTFFARRARMGIAAMCLTGLAVAVLMDLGERAWFNAALQPVAGWAGMPPLILVISVVFIIGGGMGILGMLAYLKVDEPPMKKLPEEALFRRLWKPMKDRDFLRYVAYRSVWIGALSFCGWMWWVYLLDYFRVQKAGGSHAWWVNHTYVTATLLVGVGGQVGLFLGYPVWGRAVDRFGCKPVLFVSSTLHSIAWIWWIFLSPALLPWLFLTEILGGFFYGGQDIASFNMMLGFNRRGGPGYQALATMIFNVVGALSALTAGKLAETAFKNFQWTFAPGTRYAHTFNHYALLIAIGVVIKYTADLALLPLIHEVESKPARHALRFVLRGTYGTLETRVFTPLRAGAGIAGRGLSGVKDTIADAASTSLRRWRR